MVDLSLFLLRCLLRLCCLLALLRLSLAARDRAGETNLKTKQANPECWRIPVGDGSAHKATPRRGSRGSHGASIVSAAAGGARNSGSNKSPAAATDNDNGLPSARSTAKAAKDEIHGLKWPLKLPPLVIESAAPSKKLDGSAWKANMTFLRPPAAFADEPAASSSSSSSAASSKRGEIKMALGMSQLLLRGCVLRNTKWIVGIVIFTGVETKLMLNNRKASLKRSHVDRIVDQSLYILFGIEFVLCTLGAALNYAWMDSNRHLWFLPPLAHMSRDAGLSWFTYLVLLDILIPISLYVSMELVKAAQAYWINQDIEVNAQNQILVRARVLCCCPHARACAVAGTLTGPHRLSVFPFSSTNTDVSRCNEHARSRSHQQSQRGARSNQLLLLR